MRNTITAAFLAVLCLAGAAQAQNGPVVVELYTSQGCSSCPPADAMLHDLAARPDVIALALHVDYWDYIGWKDEFGNPAYTQRQHGYARAAGATTVYTPQMIIGGVDHVVGSKPMEVMDLIQAHKNRPDPVQLNVVRNGGSVQISGTATGRNGPMVVQLVRFTPEATVAIARGENAGRSISYANIVHSWRVVGQWDGSGALSLTAPAPGRDPVVVLVQQGTNGPILAAAEVR